MEFRYLNVKDEVVKVGDQVRTDAGFVGKIYELKDGVAYINIPTYYGPGGVQVQQDASKLKKYM